MTTEADTPSSQQQPPTVADRAEHITVAGDLVKFDLRQFAQIKPDGPNVTVLSDTGAARTVLFAFAAGQQLKEHRTSSQIQVLVLRGRITFTANDGAVKAKAGTLLQLEAQTPHAITAETAATVLVIMTPSPVYHSLNQTLFRQQVPLVSRVPRAETGEAENADQ
jgi:quercetin dioxygenase-like cupin family protein